MRIVFLNPVGMIGGAERVLLSATRQLRILRPNWSLVAILGSHGPLAQELTALGVVVHIAPIPPALAQLGDTQLREHTSRWRFLETMLFATPSLFVYLRKLREVIQKSRPDVIHSHGFKTHLLTRMVSLGCHSQTPVFWHIHDYVSERPMVRKLLRHARTPRTQALAISQSVARDLAQVLPGMPLHVIPNAIDTHTFSPQGPQADLDRLAGLPASDPTCVRVGLVATYANWKGHMTFLEALARVPGVRGYIVGGPIYATAGSQVTLAELHAQRRALGLEDRVGFIPFQPHPAEVYRALDVVVHVSTRPEPFGLTIAEAMSCQRAVIVAQAGGAAELFTPGVDALGHTPGNIAELADAINRLASDPTLRTRLAQQARRTAVERFDEPRFGQQLIDVYSHSTMSHV